MNVSNWWRSLSKAQRAAYLKAHPNSVYAKGGQIFRKAASNVFHSTVLNHPGKTVLGLGAAAGIARKLWKDHQQSVDAEAQRRRFSESFKYFRDQAEKDPEFLNKMESLKGLGLGPSSLFD